ncbi:MAG: hypothetical protein KDF65_10520 [Anaerolineae bacterium]|nr:hypothetical protein [Anaerolineae bacterium]
MRVALCVVDHEITLTSATTQCVQQVVAKKIKNARKKSCEQTKLERIDGVIFGASYNFDLGLFFNQITGSLVHDLPPKNDGNIIACKPCPVNPFFGRIYPVGAPVHPLPGCIGAVILTHTINLNHHRTLSLCRRSGLAGVE